MITNTTLPKVANAAPVASDIRDIKPLLEIPSGWTWLWQLLAVLALATAAFLLWRWWRNRQRNIVPPPPVPAHLRAQEKLAAALALIGQPKPFVIAELVARVRALGRRGGENKSTVLRVANLMLDTITHQAQRGGVDIELTAREYRLLEFLMRSPGRLCGRMMILEKVWDYDFDPGTNLVDVYIMRLREKIDEGFETKLLHTVRGVGYVLKAEA